MKHRNAFRMSPAQVMAATFALLIVIGTLLLRMPAASRSGEAVPVLDACFTATTAVCVTGLVTVDTGTTWSIFGHCVILLLIQIGGLGFMTVTTMMLMAMGRRITLRERLLIQESLNEDTLQGLVVLTRRIFGIALSIEGVGALLLAFRMVPLYGWGRGLFYSVFHAVSAFCNAGIDLFGGFRSLADFRDDIWVNGVVMILIILGGLGFTVMMDLYRVVRKRSRFSRISLHSKVVLSVSGILLLAGWIFFMAAEMGNTHTLGQSDMPLYSRIMGALFQSVSTRTAGMSTFDQNAMTVPGKLGTMLFMLVGASPASTGGGIKTTTMAILIMMVVTVIRGRQRITLYGRRIEEGLVWRALAIVTVSCAMVIAAVLLLAFTEANAGNDMMTFENILYEAISGIATVGLSTGITPMLTPMGRIVMILIMFAGRVGPLTVMIAISSRIGKNKNEPRIDYPEGRIMVG